MVVVAQTTYTHIRILLELKLGQYSAGQGKGRNTPSTQTLFLLFFRGVIVAIFQCHDEGGKVAVGVAPGLLLHYWPCGRLWGRDRKSPPVLLLLLLVCILPCLLFFLLLRRRLSRFPAPRDRGRSNGGEINRSRHASLSFPHKKGIRKYKSVVAFRIVRKKTMSQCRGGREECGGCPLSYYELCCELEA